MEDGEKTRQGEGKEIQSTEEENDNGQGRWGKDGVGMRMRWARGE